MGIIEKSADAIANSKTVRMIKENPAETGIVFGAGFITGAIVDDKTHFVQKVGKAWDGMKDGVSRAWNAAAKPGNQEAAKPISDE